MLTLLDDQVDALLSDETLTNIERARTVGYLSGVILRAIEAGDIQERLEALESVLNNRKASLRNGKKR